MYRPTVRCDDTYQEYITNIFHATHLDRAQIIRAALFIAGHTDQFKQLLQPHLKRGVSLPAPLWDLDQEDLWIQQTVEKNDQPVQEKKIQDPAPEIHPIYEQQPEKKVLPVIKKSPIKRVSDLAAGDHAAASPKVFTPGGGISIKVGG